MKLSIYYQNTQGLKSKVYHFKSNVLENDFDVIILCETWLTDDYWNYELFDNRYTVFRRDRDRNATGKQDGGGCLIAVKSKYYSERMNEWELHKEDIWVSLDQLNGEKIYLNVRYIDCRSTFDVYDMHLSKINEVVNVIKPNGKFLLFGDYNLSDTITWTANSDGSCNPTHITGRIAESFIDMLSLTNLNQFNAKKNVNNRTLDLLLSNAEPNKLTTDTNNDTLSRMDNHHPPISILLDVSPLRFLEENRPPKLNFFRADYTVLNARINEINWVSELSDLNVDESLQRFYDLLSPLFELIPKTKFSVKSYPCWFTKDLIKALKLKVRARCKYLRTKNPLDYKLFADLRKEFKARKKLCEDAYIGDIEEKISVNTKAFFSYTKSLKKTNSIPNQVHFQGELADDPNAVCNLFAKYFESVFRHCTFVNFVVNQIVPDFYIDEISAADVKAMLDRLNPFKASSPDNIPSVFYKNLSSTICLPLSILYNKSIHGGVFPSVWKISNITPTFKSGNKSDVCNYRPISILAAASKVFERIVFNKLYQHVKNYITPVQHGFVSGRSTLTNLLEYATHIADPILDGGQLDTIFTDFSKAFDQVSHNLLLLILLITTIADKCSSLTITCKPNPIDCHYTIKNVVIEKKSLKKDLGVTFDSKYSYNPHITEITKKSYQMIGFIFRSTQQFKHPASLIKLYNTYVRSRLEYCSSVWNPYYEKYKEQIEKVQRKFTRMLYYKFGWVKPDYHTRLEQLNMTSLETRRLQMDEMLLFKVIHGRIDTNISHRITLHHPQRTTRLQRFHLFYLPTPTSNIQLNSPIHRIQNHHNIYFKEADITNSNFNRYKSIVKNYHPF